MNYLNESSLLETDMIPSIHRRSVNNNTVDDDVNENKSGIISGEVRRIGDSA
jgi:hypothetical protein